MQQIESSQAATKLATLNKIWPRLASEHEGEQLGCVAAIGRLKIDLRDF